MFELEPQWFVLSDETIGVHATATVNPDADAEGAMTGADRAAGLGLVDGLLITPEGVVLELEAAGPASRILARALDLTVCAAALYAVLVALAVSQPPLWVMFVALTVAVFAAIFIYPVVFETVLRGRTVGKIAAGIRVVTVAGAPIRFRHAATRSAMSVVDLVATSGFVGIVSMVASPRHQRLGDLAAGTVVVRTRVASRALALDVAAAPAGYESFTASIDTTTLTSSELETVRLLLLRRVATGHQGLEQRLERLSQHVDERLGSRRPTQMPHSVFLHCVAVADAGRTRRAAPLRRQATGADQ